MHAGGFQMVQILHEVMCFSNMFQLRTLLGERCENGSSYEYLLVRRKADVGMFLTYLSFQALLHLRVIWLTVQQLMMRGVTV